MKTINIKLFLKTGIIIHALFMYVGSCISVDNNEEDLKKTDDTVVLVSIDFAGTGWENRDAVKEVDFTGTQIITKSKNREALVVGSKPILLSFGESNSIIAYVYLKYDDEKPIEVKELEKGDKFRVIVYKKSDGTYYSHKDYTVGEPYDKMELIRGVEYILVSYSFGGEIPEVSDLEKENINTSKVQFNRDTRELVLYSKQYFIPSDAVSKNVVRIKMFNQSSSLSVSVRSLGSGIPIEETGLSIRYNSHYNTAKMNLNTGKLSCMSECIKDNTITNNIIGEGVEVFYNRQFFIPNEKKSMSMDVKFNLFGSDEYFDNIYFYMYQGKRATVYIDIRVCGAYIGSNKTNFKRFMCNDMGGEVINPSQITVRNDQHGDYYLWGLKDPVILRQFFQEQDRSKWYFDWSNASKEKHWYIEVPNRKFDDVCPKGWSVPSKNEWENVNKNNSSEYLDNNVPYAIGVRVGENMILPISGFVGYYGKNFIPKRGDGVYRWTYNDDVIDAKKMVKHAWAVAFLEKYKDNRMVSAPKFSGVSLRCVKK